MELFNKNKYKKEIVDTINNLLPCNTNIKPILDNKIDFHVESHNNKLMLIIFNKHLNTKTEEQIIPTKIDNTPESLSFIIVNMEYILNMIYFILLKYKGGHKFQYDYLIRIYNKGISNLNEDSIATLYNGFTILYNSIFDSKHHLNKIIRKYDNNINDSLLLIIEECNIDHYVDQKDSKINQYLESIKNEIFNYLEEKYDEK